jgi:hypothetical protein
MNLLQRKRLLTNKLQLRKKKIKQLQRNKLQKEERELM